MLCFNGFVITKSSASEMEADIPKKTMRDILFGTFGKAHEQKLPLASGRTTNSVISQENIQDKWIKMLCTGKERTDKWITDWGSSSNYRCTQWANDAEWGALRNGQTLSEACSTSEWAMTQCTATCCAVRMAAGLSSCAAFDNRRFMKFSTAEPCLNTVNLYCIAQRTQCGGDGGGGGYKEEAACADEDGSLISQCCSIQNRRQLPLIGSSCAYCITTPNNLDCKETGKDLCHDYDLWLLRHEEVYCPSGYAMQMFTLDWGGCPGGTWKDDSPLQLELIDLAPTDKYQKAFRYEFECVRLQWLNPAMMESDIGRPMTKCNGDKECDAIVGSTYYSPLVHVPEETWIGKPWVQPDTALKADCGPGQALKGFQLEKVGNKLRYRYNCVRVKQVGQIVMKQSKCNEMKRGDNKPLVDNKRKGYNSEDRFRIQLQNTVPFCGSESGPGGIGYLNSVHLEECEWETEEKWETCDAFYAFITFGFDEKCSKHSETEKYKSLRYSYTCIVEEWDGPKMCEDFCVDDEGDIISYYNGDGDCDDGGPGSDYNLCQKGTDCTDCAVRCEDWAECDGCEDWGKMCDKLPDRSTCFVKNQRYGGLNAENLDMCMTDRTVTVRTEAESASECFDHCSKRRKTLGKDEGCEDFAWYESDSSCHIKDSSGSSTGSTVTTSASECHDRCLTTEGCESFSWYSKNGSCHIQDSSGSTHVYAKDVTSGQRGCDPNGSKYYMEPKYTDACPRAHDITTKEECAKAIEALGLCTSSPWTGSSNYIPLYCSVRPEHCGNDDMHFNSASAGRAGDDYAPICLLKATKYYVEPKNTDACPSGHEITTEDECAKAIEALGFCTGSPWTGSNEHIPPFCSVRPEHCGNHDMHFNSASAGSARNDIAPICFTVHTQ